ncbi:Major sperm protein [Aphelenchoides besseyi]|nr:Major sperm protein [Aphelenchoides besseyi]
MAKPQEAKEHLMALMHDSTYFSARWLKLAREKTGLDEEHVAAGFGIVIAGYLLVGERAQFVCNLLLVAIPLIVTYVYPKERPAVDQLLVYWASFASLSLLDLGFEEFIPAYYVIKLALMGLLFLRPFCYAEQAAQLLRVFEELSSGRSFSADQLQELEKMARGRKSPPPEKPEQEEQKLMEKAPDSLRRSPKPNSATARHADSSTRTAVAKSAAETSSEKKLVDDSAPVVTASARTPRQETNGRDAMIKDSVRFALTDNSSDEGGIETHGANAPVNLHDFVTRPLDKIVFNAPFADNVLQYHIVVMNNTPRTMAFAMKSNAIPRVTANPPCGILKPREQMLVWVNVQPFNINEQDVSRDRLAFDYVFCPPDTKKFSFNLLQGIETRRRKNLRVEYNV